MFNFTTTTIVNSVSDVDYKILTNKEGNKALYVKNVGSFSPDVEITKRAYMPEKMAKAVLTVPTSGSAGDIFRVTIDIELYKSESSLYARPWPTKGKPIYIEAIKGSAALENTLAENASKYMNLVYDKEILAVEAKSGSLEITAKEGTQVLKSVILEKWVPDTTGNLYAGGVWKEVEGASVAETKGFPGFGTYSHMIHNVVLPTYENIRYGNAVANSPKIDGNYTQFVVTMEKERDPYGTGAVGQKLTSVTQHVFWVAANALTAFEKKFKTDLGAAVADITFSSDPADAAQETSLLDE